VTNPDIRQYLDNAQYAKQVKHRMTVSLPILSLVVIMIVFWSLKLVGITMAGEAFCGMPEHVHSEECMVSTLICQQQTADTEPTQDTLPEETAAAMFALELTAESTVAATQPPQLHAHTESCYEISYTCGQQEHTHIADCYSDLSADLETADIWEATLADISDDLTPAERMLAVAQSQLGYTESQLNFAVDAEGIRRGYTRYGEWYGNPYGDWSAMFAAFCLHYAGFTEEPINAGPEAMRLEWEALGRYQTAGNHTPYPGDLVFLDSNANGAADAVAVVQALSDGLLYVIQGDLENQVAETAYPALDPMISGYGVLMPERSLLVMAAPMDASAIIATAVDYSANLLRQSDTCFVLYTQDRNGNYYAIDGNSNAVQVYLDANGNLSSDVADPNTLLWIFEHCGTYDNQTSYYIQNIGTGQYLHPYVDSATSHGAILSGRWESAVYPSGSGVKFRGARQNAYAQRQGTIFSNIDTLAAATEFRFASAEAPCTVWLDGTNGGLMALGGSPNTAHTVREGDTIQLPLQWQSPEKYSYTLRGWYDVINSRYYAPGAEITVTQNMVFYADWVASSYDFGQFNSQVADTVSTNNYITVNVFDYNSLFNIQSAKATVTASAAGHSETWQQVTSGNVPYNNAGTLDFIFVDYDGGGDISLTNDRGNNNVSGGVYSGLYHARLGEILFGTENSFNPITGTGVIGKQYLGTGDHLFQLMTDPDDEHYGYYYYDSQLNAASYNQSQNRFYVYEYLERTADSANASGDGKNSDFLPLNSPYANTNGKDPVTYTYDGDKGEYVGTTHYQYDAKYNTGNNNPSNIMTNYAFGMSIQMEFFLPDRPGAIGENGQYGNRDLQGKQMHFKFSGDDDVWVLVDGKLVLDIGGIHGVESGDINFSTGVVTVNGEQTGTLYDISEGDHVLTVYYLERGSSQSNCAFYFNLAPRFSLSIQKEDVLTQHVLNGARFSVYTDRACTKPAQLWTSQEAHDDGEPATNTFTVEGGVANFWGLSTNRTYYIKETGPPDADGYGLANGIICLSLDKDGVASYSVEVIPDEHGNLTGGFTVHGFRIDEETQQAYVVVTNAQDWVQETTTVQVLKKWNDTEDHTRDTVTAYLTITDPDGTVRRIREILLSEAIDWEYIWTNLPKYGADGVTEIVYGVEEAYQSGYHATIEKIDQIVIEESKWAEAYAFENGKEYILKTDSGCLSAVSATAETLKWVDEETARGSPLALWTATVSRNNILLTNREGQKLTFNNGNNNNNRYFYVTTRSVNNYQNIVPVETQTGLRLYVSRNSTPYYMSSINNSNRLTSSTSTSSALIFRPMTLITEEIIREVEDEAFQITNTPLEEETSLKVYKTWDVGVADPNIYQQAQVTVKLLANGKDAGRTVTLSLKNGWEDTFQGLPYKDSDGNIITYTVEESWDNNDWLPSYSDVTVIGGDINTYEVTVTNTYRWGHGVELPSTGGLGQIPWIFGGLALMLASLTGACILRRKRKRGYG